MNDIILSRYSINILILFIFDLQKDKNINDKKNELVIIEQRNIL